MELPALAVRPGSHQIIPGLKRLRLSGILETLDVRNDQAIEGRWSYIEFPWTASRAGLARLVEDEVERREQKQLGLRLRRAAVDTTKTLEGFDFSFPGLTRQGRQPRYQPAAGAGPGGLHLYPQKAQCADLWTHRCGEDPSGSGPGPRGVPEGI